MRKGRSIGIPQGFEDAEDFCRLQAFAGIGFDEGVNDGAVGVDHIGRCQGQLEAVIAVDLRQVQPKALVGLDTVTPG